jgi:hypothetical protein
VRSAAFSLAVGLVLADSSVAVLALPAIYRELEVDLGDLHWVLTTSNLVLALVRLRPRGSRAQHWRNHWRATRRLPLKVRRLQQFSQRCTPLPKPRAHVRFMPGALPTKVRPLRGHDDFRRVVLSDEAEPAAAAHVGRGSPTLPFIPPDVAPQDLTPIPRGFQRFKFAGIA